MSSNKTKSNNMFLQKKRSRIKSKEIDKKPIIKIGPWNEHEDNLLRKWVEKNGAYNWMKCAEYMKDRTAKQCREHWKNSLDSNLIVGNWSAEEDLLIMKFYKKYKSWSKMIPMFEGRTENSIKNRFFSQLRRIVVKKRPKGRKEYGTKFGLDILLNYLDEGIKQAEKKYYEENKNMTKENFENYMMQIENSIKNKKKGKKYIDLKSIKKKNLNSKNKISDIINIDKDKDENILLNEKDEDLETFNGNNKMKSEKYIFKTVRNSEESNTREETMNSKDMLMFRKKKLKTIKEVKKLINEENAIKEEEIVEIHNLLDDDKKDKNDKNKEFNKKISKKYSKKISFKNEEVKNQPKDNKNNFYDDKFAPPINYHEYKIRIYNNNNCNYNALQRSESLSNINENEDNKHNEKKKENDNFPYINKTSNNIGKFKKGKFISLASIK